MVAYSDTHTVPVPKDWNARDFAKQVLGNAPGWLTRLLDIRDSIVQKLGFATQPSNGKEVDIRVGGTAGPFTFDEVSDQVVRGGNTDKHINFESSFTVRQTSSGSLGVLDTKTSSRDKLGGIYLRLIWPAHKLIMQRVLRSGMQNVDSAS